MSRLLVLIFCIKVALATFNEAELSFNRVFATFINGQDDNLVDLLSESKLRLSSEDVFGRCTMTQCRLKGIKPVLKDLDLIFKGVKALRWAFL